MSRRQNSFIFAGHRIRICSAPILALISALAGSYGFNRPASAMDHPIVVQAGALTTNIGITSTQNTAQSSLINTVYPAIGVQGRFDLNDDWEFLPALAYTLPPRNSGDSAASVYILTVTLPLAQDLGWIEPKFGPGIFFESIVGNGGAESLNNGNTMTTFFKPGRSSTTHLFYWDAGFGVDLSERFRIDADLFVTGVLTDRRAFNAVLMLGFGLF